MDSKRKLYGASKRQISKEIILKENGTHQRVKQ